MQPDFEAMGGTYTQAGDYLLPDVEAPESPQIGIWGERRRKYLQEHDKATYTAMLLGDFLETLPIDDNNNLFSLICQLCIAFDQKAYIDGLQAGAHLINELCK